MLARQGCGKKKLADAARYWAARPAHSSSTDARAEDPQEWQDAIAAHEESTRNRDGDEEDCFLVWPENAKTVRVFEALRRCWRVDSMAGQYLGLDRTQIESTLRLMRIHHRKHLLILGELEIMEDAALEVMNRK